ncbi:hypothetical protein ACFLTA_00475 [Bacteroidota bacterium]
MNEVCETPNLDHLAREGIVLDEAHHMGFFSEEITNILLEMGEWLKINGEAIYDAVPRSFYGEGEADWEQTADAITVKIPAGLNLKHAVTFKLER